MPGMHPHHGRGGRPLRPDPPLHQRRGGPVPGQGDIDPRLPLLRPADQEDGPPRERVHHAVRHRLPAADGPDGEPFRAGVHEGAGGMVEDLQEPVRVGLRHQFRQLSLPVPEPVDDQGQHGHLPRPSREDALLADRLGPRR